MPSLSPAQIATLNYRYNNLAEYRDDGSAIPIDPLIYRDPDGDTLLHTAACANDIEAVSWLLNAGANPNCDR